MKTRKYKGFLLSVVTVVIVAILLGFEFFIQVNGNRRQAYRTGDILIDQVVALIENNDKKILLHTESLKEDYITRAKAVAYIIDQNYKLAYSHEELSKIAQLVLVDEIHLFNTKGTIYAGTVPKYYGYSFDSGEQMAYFKPMLEDKNLSMCQDVTPNTAESKLMMYAICWNEDGTRMIQVGIEPLRLIGELRANEISEVVDNMPSYSGVDIAIANTESGEIVGSTLDGQIGKTLSDIGIDISKYDFSRLSNFSARMWDRDSYCSAKNYGEYTIVIANDKKSANSNVLRPLILTSLYIIAAVMIIYIIVRNMTMQIIEEQKSANTDQLTGLYNRRAYEMDIEDFSKAPLPGNLTYISMDLNGLKTANDNLGHDAGDRLIKGAADCMLQCFNKYGKVYRIGGDEFAAIIFTENDLQELINEFRLLCEKWSNDNKLKLAVSCGHVISKDYAGQNLHELSKLADTAMYRDKDDYYRENGLDRRKS